MLVLLSLPEFRVTGTTFDERLWKEVLVAVVDGVVGLMGRRDQELGVENFRVASLDVLYRDGVEVVDVEATVNLVPLGPEVASEISSNNVMAKVAPLCRTVEALVEVALEPEGRKTDVSPKSQVPRTFLDRVELREFGIRTLHWYSPSS
jgi:hypothetical protein